jgi:hypothetical protein
VAGGEGGLADHEAGGGGGTGALATAAVVGFATEVLPGSIYGEAWRAKVVEDGYVETVALFALVRRLLAVGDEVNGLAVVALNEGAGGRVVWARRKGVVDACATIDEGVGEFAADDLSSGRVLGDGDFEVALHGVVIVFGGLVVPGLVGVHGGDVETDDVDGEGVLGEKAGGD